MTGSFLENGIYDNKRSIVVIYKILFFFFFFFFFFFCSWIKIVFPQQKSLRLQEWIKIATEVFEATGSMFGLI